MGGVAKKVDVTSVVDNAKTLGEVQLKVVWAWAMHVGIPHRTLRAHWGYSEHPRRVVSEVCVCGSFANHHSHPPRIHVLRTVMQDTITESLLVGDPHALGGDQCEQRGPDLKHNTTNISEVLQAMPKVASKLSGAIHNPSH